MPDEMIEKLFKADAETTRPGTNGEHSTGLGLLLCKEFVQKHGSKIDVESEVGRGSVFSFSIPCSVNYGEIEVPNSFLKTEVKESTLNNLKFIIAEEDIISGKLILTMIKRFCKEVLIVRTGSEVVEVCLANADIDLVLMDISMPQVDGYEASRRIREFNKEVIIIAQTALASESDIKDALAAGCNDHIAKPINSNELNLLIHKYFN